MWRPGPPITLTATDTAQHVTTTVGLVKAVRFEHHWNNANRIYWGDSTLDPAAPLGILGWLPVPQPGNPPPAEVMIEPDAPGGINSIQLFVAGTAGEIVLWSFLEQ